MSETETTQAVTPAESTTPPVDPTTRIDAPLEQAVTPAEQPPADVKPDGETNDQANEERRKPSGSQRLKNRLRLIETDYLAAQNELEQLRREKQERDSAPQNNSQGRPGVDRAPTEQDFPNDWFAFQEAKTAWTARQAIREEFGRVREEDSRRGSERAQLERRSELLESYQESAAEARERIPDFDKVLASAQSIQIKPDLVEEIMSSDKAALLQYHLAKNPDKVRELNQLSGRELAREIGRLEARVHLPTAKKATEASPPPAEVRGGAAPPVDPQTGPDDMNAYVAWRKKQMARA